MISFLIIGLILVSGCEITPENIDVVANAIQKKYDNINSYQTKIVSTNGPYSKEVIRQVKRSDKFKTILNKNGDTVRVELCNKDIQIYYDTSTTKVTATKIINFDCTKKVSEFFNVFDRIKNIFSYDYVIDETELDVKLVVHLTLSSKESDHDYWSEQFWFDKSNYQLIKHSYEAMGKEIVTNFDGLQLNINIPDNEFIFEFPDDVEVSVSDAHGGTEIPITQKPSEEECATNDDCKAKTNCTQPEDPLCFSVPYCSNGKCTCVQGCS